MVIIAWLDRSGSLASPIVDGLFSALGDARNYFDAEAAAKRLVALGDLGDVASDRLAALYWENDQVHGGVLPNRVLKPFYAQHDRAYPPSKSALVPVADEPPF